MEFTIDYFIDKFSKLREDEIGYGEIDTHCALFHCGIKDDDYKDTPESNTLGRIFKDGIFNPRGISRDLLSCVYEINDDTHNLYISGDTPKQRILNALQICKEKEMLNL